MRTDSALAQRRGEPFHVLVGTALGELLDPDNGGTLLTELEEQRRALEEAHGVVLPSVATSDDPDLDTHAYVIYLWGARQASGRFPAETIPTRIKLPPFINKRLFGPRVPEPGCAPESRYGAAARIVVTEVVKVALEHRDQLSTPPTAPTTPLTPGEEQFIEEVIQGEDATSHEPPRRFM